LVLMFSAGPSFFYLVKVGIEQGFRKAASFAVGIFFSDILLLGLIYLGLKPFFENETFRQIFSLVSGVVISVFGITMLIKKKPTENAIKDDLKGEDPFYKYLLKGAAINLLNPFTVIVWVTVLGSVSPGTKTEFSQFIGGLLGIILLSDAVKAYLAKLIGKLLTQKAVFRLNKVMGVAFIAIGVYFMYVFYQSYFGGHQIDMEVPSI